jgi:hypothetical protein
MLSGDAELEHWKNLIKSKKDRKLRDRGNFRKGKRGFGGRKDFPQVRVMQLMAHDKSALSCVQVCVKR